MNENEPKKFQIDGKAYVVEKQGRLQCIFLVEGDKKEEIGGCIDVVKVDEAYVRNLIANVKASGEKRKGYDEWLKAQPWIPAEFELDLPQIDYDRFKEGSKNPMIVGEEIKSKLDIIAKGWTRGETWNGWACPVFSFESAQHIAKRLNGIYDAAKDHFVFPPRGDSEESDVFGSATIPIDGKQVKVYAIGAGCWIWSTRRAGGWINLPK